MRFLFITLFLTFFITCQEVENTVKTPSVVHQSFNEDWEFIFEDQTPVSVSLPHIPRVEPLIVNDQWQGKHAYVKSFVHDLSTSHRAFLHFEGVMHESVVFVNGERVKENKGGYLPFTADLTDFLKQGSNKIRVEVSNEDNPVIPPGKPLEELDFNFYGGIYRDIWLVTKDQIYITDPFIENTKEAGWLVHFDQISSERAEGVLSVEVKNESNDKAYVKVKATLSDGDEFHTFHKIVELRSGSQESVDVRLVIENPKLWSRTAPILYNLKVEVSSEGKIYDQIEDRVGVRKIELSDEGFFLNGEKQFLRGTNRHQEYPYVGYAISNNANYRDALKIKNAGFDFVRLSHYPHDEAFLDACDELGLLVMNAIPGWQHYQEGQFIENAYQDIRKMVRRDRNHPSVVFWEVSLNESGMTEAFMEKANATLKEELPFEDTYSAGWMDHSSYDLYIPARQHGKPPHYWNNHKEGKRNVFIAEYGDWEYYAHNAGFNQTAYSDLSEEQRNSRQLRAHGEHRLLQQAMNFQEAANSNRKGIGTIGHANWLMFDYNRGYADDLEASGISDIFRLPKFAHYFYQSQRPPHEDINHPLVEDGPMIKIACYWTKESPTNVRVFSNCEEVALYLNNRLIAKQKPLINQFSDHLAHPPFEFQVSKFERGTLKAVGIIGGKEVVSDELTTPGEPTQVRIKMDTTYSAGEEESDVFFVYAEITDRNGTIVPTATHEIYFKLKGEGELIGQNPVKAEAGIATILLKTSTKSVKAFGENLVKGSFKVVR